MKTRPFHLPRFCKECVQKLTDAPLLLVVASIAGELPAPAGETAEKCSQNFLLSFLIRLFGNKNIEIVIGNFPGHAKKSAPYQIAYSSLLYPYLRFNAHAISE